MPGRPVKSGRFVFVFQEEKIFHSAGGFFRACGFTYLEIQLLKYTKTASIRFISAGLFPVKAGNRPGYQLDAVTGSGRPSASND